MRPASARSFGQRTASPSIPTPRIAIRPARPKRKSLDDLKAAAVDRRKYRRIKVRLSGRFMREDQHEYPCYTNDISAGGMNISAAVKCEPGEYVVFYIEEIGRIEGYVVRNHDDGFAIAIEASAHKREKIVACLTWILNRHELQDADGRRHTRETPTRPLTSLVRTDGTEIQAKVLDLSIGGARISVNADLHPGEKIYLGKSRGHVVRAGTDGIAIQFDTEQSSQALHPYFADD